METGDFLGRYRVVRKIGEGGMGEVFLAEDPKLNRQIAVKVLSADFASDQDRMARFVHEAISASALNHPNIITIHEINDEHDPPFIAMEYVEGGTLGRRIRERPLEIHETLEIAIQVATALAAAHDANVVHRDVKPDNVILRPDGLVKVLDFGLAKQAERGAEVTAYEAATVPNVKTHPGLVMGTVAYMSPEQARGKLVDARSDIFSFGSMLYQMTSGRLPFIGENDLDVVGSILHKEPRPLSQSARLIPHDVELLIKKALRKNREERYQSMREIVADLKDIREDLRTASNGHPRSNGYSSGPLSDAERGMPTEKMHGARIHSTRELSLPPGTLSGILYSQFKTHPIRSAGFSVVLMLFIAAVAFGLYRISDTWARTVNFETMRFDKLTFSGDVASEQVALSPEGKYFAYVTSAAGEQSLWMKQTGEESNLQIIGPSGNQYNGLTFSPDGNRIYYSVKEKDGPQSIYQIPALGGPSRKIAENGKGPVAFSPDGKKIAFRRAESFVVVANADGSDVKEIAKGDGEQRWIRVAFSPDGTKLAAVYFSPKDSFDHLAELTIADGSIRAMEPPEWQNIRGVAWLPDGKVLVSGRDKETQLSQLWVVDPTTGSRTRVTNDPNNYMGLSISADGRSVLSTQHVVLSNLWVAGSFNDRPVKLTSEIGKNDGMSGVSFMPDGRMLYTTRVKGDQDIWIVNGDGSGNRQLTMNARSNFSPVPTPDGRFIVFASTRNGDTSLWKMDSEGGNVVPLTGDPGSEAYPTVTPDGRWVVFQHTDPSNISMIKKVSIDGGEILPVSNVEAVNPALSPDGSLLVCKYDFKRTNRTQIGILPIEGGEPVKLLNSPAMGRSRSIRFSPDGRSLIYVDGRDRVDNLWEQPIDGGPGRQLTNFGEDQIFLFDISYPTGRFVFARGTDTSDVVMIRNFR
jgi:serine/threonine protein kinase/Tol biopolymer transport system component